MLLVLDTSVILKWFFQENYSDIAVKIREDFYEEAHEIVEPDLLLYEFTNVLRYNPIYTRDVRKAKKRVERAEKVCSEFIEFSRSESELCKKYEKILKPRG